MPRKKPCPPCGKPLNTAYIREGSGGKRWIKVGLYCKHCKTFYW